jgi:hypothetical protein
VRQLSLLRCWGVLGGLLLQGVGVNAWWEIEKEPKHSKSRVKGKKKKKKELATILVLSIENLLTRKRCFSDLNREFDQEREQLTQRLEQLYT